MTEEMQEIETIESKVDVENDGLESQEDTGGETGTLEGDAELADQQEDDEQQERTSKQDPEVDAGFARLRREKEQLEQQLKQRDSWVAENFGKSHGITTWDQYQQAIEATRQRQAEQQKQQYQENLARTVQQMREEGYSEPVIQSYVENAQLKKEVQELKNKMLTTEQTFQQQQQQQQEQQAMSKVNTDFEKLKGKYPEFQSIEDLGKIDQDKWKIVQAVYNATGDLVQAYESAHPDMVSKKATQKALKDVNSKSHLMSEKSTAGDLGQVVDLSAEQLRVWRAMGYSEKEARKRAAKYMKKGGK